MKLFVYAYRDPLYEPPPDATEWGWDRDRLYFDFGERHQFQQLLADCQAAQRNHEDSYVVVRSLPELGETVEVVCDRLEALQNGGATVVVLDSPEGDAGDRAARLAQLRRLQAQQHSQRVRRGHARRRVAAQPPPGKAPYGYRRGRDRYVLDRTTAPVVKAFFEHFLLYGSLRGAVRYLAQRYSKRVSVTTGRRWLTNPVYRGDLAYRDGRTIADTHVAILSRSEAAQIDRLLRRNRRLAPRAASAPRSLAGLVACHACGSSMTIARVTRRRQSGEYLYLRPIACPRSPKCSGLRYEAVLHATIDRVCSTLQAMGDRLPEGDLDGAKAGVQQQIADKQAVLARLPALLAQGVLDAETLDLRSYHLRAEISSLQDRLAQLPPVNLRETAKTVSLPQFWWDLTESERRFYLREFVRQVWIRRDSPEWTVDVEFMF